MNIQPTMYEFRNIFDNTNLEFYVLYDFLFMQFN